MKKLFIGIIGALVVSMLPVVDGGQVWAQGGGTVPLQASDIKLIEGPSMSFEALRGSITAKRDAHLQITIVNSSLNDYSLVGEIEFKIPRTLTIGSSTDGASGGATSTIMQITNPISPGTAESFDLFIQAYPEATGDLSLSAIVRYWAIDLESGLENKADNRSISRDQIIKVIEPTDPGRFGSSSDGSSSDSDNAQADTGSNASESNSDDSGFDLEWWMIVLAVLGVILAVALVLGLFRIIFS
jgi:hypothetical protein